MAEDELRQLQEQLAALTVSDFVVSAASTLATLASAKLEAKDLAQAKQAIDALGSLLPYVEGQLAGELKAALTSLQVAFAQAASEEGPASACDTQSPAPKPFGA